MMILIKKIELSDIKSIQEVYIELEDNIETLEISYTYDKKYGVIDLGLMKEDAIIGWSGGSKNKIVISERYSTPGYLKTKLNKGLWKILLGVYDVKVKEGFSVTIEINKIPKVGRWVKGVTHMHSVHSDGKFTVQELIQMGKLFKMDYLIFSDHNTVSQNKEVLSINDPDIIGIPGMELTTYNGHTNFVGVKKPIKDFRWTLKDFEMNKIFEEAKSNGAFIGINHPFCPSCGWKYSMNCFDWIEIWNETWGIGNKETLNWWTDQLKQGKKIPIVGGSDFHKIREGYEAFIIPTNYVFVNDLTQDSVLNAMKRGNSIILNDSYGISIEFKTIDAIPGELSKSNEIFINIQQLPNNFFVSIITDKDEFNISSNSDSINNLFNCSNLKFAYLIIKNEESVIGITNPIYFE